MLEAQTFLEELVAAVPYSIHTILTDNGIQFADTTKIVQVRRLCAGDILVIGLAASMVSNIV